MKTLQSLLAFCILFVSLSNAQKMKYSFKESYAVTPDAQLMVSTSDGNIDLVSSPGNEIEVFFIAKRNNSVLQVDREALEKEVILEVIQDQNSVKITVKDKNKYSDDLFRKGINVSFEIHAPEKTACNFNTSDGNISLAGLAGDQKLKTSDGNIRIADVGGNIIGKTSDGDISVRAVKGSVGVSTSDGNIEVTNITGDVQSSTSDGNIVISNVEGNTSSKTSDGHITFKELSGSFTGITSDGNIRGNFLQLKQELTVRTGDGNIDITIPGNLGLDLDIKGESLDVPLNNFSRRSDEESIQGQSNGGGIPVNLSTSDGRVVLAFQ